MPPTDAFRHQLEQCALLSIEKHDTFMRIVGDRMHELDLDAGRLRFDGNLEFPVQVLGTESDNTLTFLWAWAEEQTEIPEPLVQASLQARHWGAREGVREFTLPSVDLDVADGNALASVATHVLNANSFFRDSYEGGAAYLLLFPDRSFEELTFDRAALTRHLADLAARYDLDLRRVLTSYLRAKNIPHSEEREIVNAEMGNGERLVVSFAGAGKITDINGEPFAG